MTKLTLRSSISKSSAVFCLLFSIVSCGKGAEVGTTDQPCPVLNGTPWVPSVTGAGASNHDDSVAVSQVELPSVTGPVIGLSQPAPPSTEITVNVPMMEDLGVNGSFSLIAQVKNAPEGIDVYPVLVYLSDGTHDFINLARSGVWDQKTALMRDTSMGQDWIILHVPFSGPALTMIGTIGNSIGSRRFLGLLLSILFQVVVGRGESIPPR